MGEMAVPLVLTLTLLGQPADESPAAQAEKKERLQFLQGKAAEFTLCREAGTVPYPLREEPILRYSIPERDNGTWDGATFLWLRGTRPVAATSFGIRRPNDKVVFEHTSFSGTPLVCSREGTAVWSPQAGGLLEKPFPDAPAPAETVAGRLVQMRALARRFSATCYWAQDITQLRLLPQPLYRFADEKSGILDGALFTLVVSNDPEVFILLEAARPDESGSPAWRYSLARMSSLKQTVRLDEHEIWTIRSFYSLPAGERKAGPYIEGPNGTYPGAGVASGEK